MAKYCEVCHKGISSGNQVSHSNRKTRRKWAPNIQTKRMLIDGVAKKVHICTRCMRSGKVCKA